MCMHIRGETPSPKLSPLKHQISKRGMLQGPITPWAGVGEMGRWGEQ